MFWLAAQDAIRDLYLKLVKKYHPDLALSQSDKAQRHEKMVQINNAYERGDMRTLQLLSGITPTNTGRHDRNPDGSHASHCRWCDRFEEDARWRPRPGSPPPGYSDYPKNTEKEEYLRKANAYLVKVGRMLKSKYGFDDNKVRTNKGGPAVDGEVYGYFYKSGEPFGIFVQVSKPREGWGQGEIMARWRARDERGKHTGEGPNVWLKRTQPEILSADLYRIWQTAGR